MIPDNVHVSVFTRDGRLKAERSVHNVFTNTGRRKLVELLHTGGTINNYLYAILVGSGVTPPDEDDTELDNYLGFAGVSVSYPDGGHTARASAVFSPGTLAGTISEIGQSGGLAEDLWCRAIIDPPVPVTVDDYLVATYELSYPMSS